MSELLCLAFTRFHDGNGAACTFACPNHLPESWARDRCTENFPIWHCVLLAPANMLFLNKIRNHEKTLDTILAFGLPFSNLKCLQDKKEAAYVVKL